MTYSWATLEYPQVFCNILAGVYFLFQEIYAVVRKIVITVFTKVAK